MEWHTIACRIHIGSFAGPVSALVSRSIHVATLQATGNGGHVSEDWEEGGDGEQGTSMQ